VLVAGSARRHEAETEAALVAPFTARPTGAGYGSSMAGERGRAEMWLPLWSAFSTLREIDALAREARARVGRRRARTGLDFVRAAGELGVARGIDAFERYAVLERAGQSSLAVAAGRVAVTPQPSARALRSLDGWLEGVLRFAGGDRCPRAARSAIRHLERDLFTLAERTSPESAGTALESLGAVEGALARGARRAIEARLWPLRGAPADPWLQIADDGSAEFTVATSLASLRDRDGTAIRDLLHGTTLAGGRRAFDPQARASVHAPGELVGRLAELHARRALGGPRTDGDAASGHPSAQPFSFGLSCDAGALRRFASGELDDARIARLLEGLCLLDFSRSRRPPAQRIPAPPMPPFELLALAWAGTAHTPLSPRPGWAARLRSGAVRAVLADATLRLRLAGLVPSATVSDLLISRLDGPRLAAALLVSLGEAERRRIVRRLTLPSTTTTEENR